MYQNVPLIALHATYTKNSVFAETAIASSATKDNKTADLQDVQT
jgi:hypothetical protein